MNQEQLRDNPAHKTLMEGLEAGIIAQIKALNLDGTQESIDNGIELIRLLQAHGRYQLLQNEMISHGKIAEINQKNKKRKFL